MKNLIEFTLKNRSEIRKIDCAENIVKYFNKNGFLLKIENREVFCCVCCEARESSVIYQNEEIYLEEYCRCQGYTGMPGEEFVKAVLKPHGFEMEAEEEEMGQLEIKQEFLDYIKKGIKKFEIRKEPDLAGEVELVVFQKHNFENEVCINCKLELPYGTSPKEAFENCIKDSLKVKLTRTNLTAVEIILKLLEMLKQTKKDFIIFGECSNWRSKAEMLVKVIDFLKVWFKQGDSLYWYDLEVID